MSRSQQEADTETRSLLLPPFKIETQNIEQTVQHRLELDAGNESCSQPNTSSDYKHKMFFQERPGCHYSSKNTRTHTHKTL